MDRGQDQLRRMHKTRNKQTGPEGLGAKLQELRGGLSDALQRLQTVAGNYQQSDITLEAALDAEFVFALIAKTGVKGSVSLKVVRA